MTDEMTELQRQVLDLSMQHFDRLDELCVHCGMRYGLHSAQGAQCAAPLYAGWSDPPTYFKLSENS